MFKLMGKFKMKQWEEIDTAETMEDMNYLENEYKNELGQGWLFKVEKVENEEGVPA